MINIVLSKTTIFIFCYKNEFNYSSVFNDFSRVWVLINYVSSTNLNNYIFFVFLEKTYVLHISGGTSVGKITKFTLEIFQKCKDILKVRSERKLKSSIWNYKQDLSDVLGYHIDCYRKFTVLWKTDREVLKSLLSDKQETKKVTTRWISSKLRSYHNRLELFNENVYFVNN